MNIRVYSTPTCPYCKMVKGYLDEKGVAYQDIDVSSDEAGKEEMVKKSAQMGVPVIDVHGTIIIGFDKEKIEKALKDND